MTETVHNNCPGCGAPINSARCPYCGRDHDNMSKRPSFTIIRGKGCAGCYVSMNGKKLNGVCEVHVKKDVSVDLNLPAEVTITFRAGHVYIIEEASGL